MKSKKPRFYMHYNSSQILSELQCHPNDLEVVINIAYEIANRRRISKEKRLQVITTLEEITRKVIDSKNQEILDLKQKLTFKGQRIKELEVTENIISTSINILKEQILQTVHHELKNISMLLSEKTEQQDNRISDLKRLISRVENVVGTLKEADKRILIDREDSKTHPSKLAKPDTFHTGEVGDLFQNLPENIPLESKREDPKSGVKINDDHASGTAIPPEEGLIQDENVDGEGMSVLEENEIEDIERISTNEETHSVDKAAPPHSEFADPHNDTLFDELRSENQIIIENYAMVIEGDINKEVHRKLVIYLGYNSSGQPSPKDVCLYFYYWWCRLKDQEDITLDFIFDLLKQDIQSIQDNNPVMIIEPNFTQSSSAFFKLALKGMQEVGLKWFINPELKLLGGYPVEYFNDNKTISKFVSHLSTLLKRGPETFELFMLQMMIKNELPDGVKYSLSSHDIHHVTKFIADNAEELEIIDSQEKFNSGDFPESTDKEHFNNIEVKTIDLVENKDPGKTTFPGTTIPLFEIKQKEQINGKKTYRPRNYWILRIIDNNIQIHLELGIRDIYTPESLSTILGIDVVEKEYRFFLDDKLICVFRAMIDGNYKTEWQNDQKIKWDGDTRFYDVYVKHKDNKYEISDFINSYPVLEKPSLWYEKSEMEWQLSKGNNISSKKGAILHPGIWQVNGAGHTSSYEVYGKNMLWTLFEGKINIRSINGDSIIYQSNVRSFNRLILGEFPEWITKFDITVVQNKLKLVVYNTENEINITDESDIWIKSFYKDSWLKYSENMKIPEGLVKLKIENNGIVDNSLFFNIGNLRIETQIFSASLAQMSLINNPFDKFYIKDTPEYHIYQDSNKTYIELNSHAKKIPETLKCQIGNENERKLTFHMRSPVSGLCLVDNSNNILEPEHHIFSTRMEGFQILSRKDLQNSLSFKNSLRPDVVISRELKHGSTPLISFTEEIRRLLYLKNIMSDRNSVTLELSDGTNDEPIAYTISRFTHLLNIEKISNNILKVEGPKYTLDLFAVPIDCAHDKIKAIPILGNDVEFYMPTCDFADRFIIISKKREGYQMMPHLVTLDTNYISGDKQEDIEEYHRKLANNFFTNMIWRETLAYFNKCIKFEIPFSTFDQIKAFARSSKTAAKAFLYFGINQENRDFYIQEVIPNLEKDLGISFLWIAKSDWAQAMEDVLSSYGNTDDNFLFKHLVDLIKAYLKSNGLSKISTYLFSENQIEADPINNEYIMDFRRRLQERVLSELPKYKPKIKGYYGIPYNKSHKIVTLLFHAPIAVAESIAEVQTDTPIWGGDNMRDNIRRNIQYSQYLDPEFYNKVIFHVLHHIKKA